MQKKCAEITHTHTHTHTHAHTHTHKRTDGHGCELWMDHAWVLGEPTRKENVEVQMFTHTRTQTQARTHTQTHANLFLSLALPSIGV